ncbi:hypothetical protein EVA_20496 [gut metagenome]|uniref:Uncharacterized protein n=1 Tax=gut metagenome TaxID=749906 RepID=J9FP83_9ZZZZ
MAAGVFKGVFLPRGQFVYVFVDCIYRAVFGNEFPGSDLSDAFHSGDVVRCVPADCQHVYDLFRR